MHVNSPPPPAIQPRAYHHRIAFWHRLRWNLIAYFVALTVLPIAVVIGITLVRTSAQSQRQIFNQLGSVAELKEDQITRWLDSSGTILRLIPTGNQERLLGLLADPAPDPPALAAVNRLLSDSRQAQAAFEEFFIYDPRGTVVASSDPVQIGKILVNQPYFAASLRAGVVQPPYYEIGSGDLAMFITHPLLDAGSGALVGVLGGRLDTSTLGQIMTNRTGLGDSGETYLVSLENNYLLTPSRFEAEGYLPNRAYHSQGIDRALRGETGAAAYPDYRDPPQTVLGVYRWIPELQVAMLAESEEALILAPLRQTNAFSLTIAIVAALLSAAIGLYKATRIAAPITTLTAVAEEVAAGDLSQRVGIKERNEIGVLAEVFNGMTTQLRQTQEGLEQRVAERTAELEHTVNQLQHALNVHDELRATIRSLDSPIVPVQEGILVMSLVGELDIDRSGTLIHALLERIADQHARFVVIDVTGVSAIDGPVAQTLVQIANMVKLLGAQAILVGMRPELCEAVIGLGIDLSNLITHADLQSGVTFAIAQHRSRRARTVAA
ncbi:MAG TPA: cache domain-containing protein [Herpetosiphonaceae bacterium]|nr:cache domain-containing protein [Herpetosiphonaceae bacterium]